MGRILKVNQSSAIHVRQSSPESPKSHPSFSHCQSSGRFQRGKRWENTKDLLSLPPARLRRSNSTDMDWRSMLFRAISDGAKTVGIIRGIGLSGGRHMIPRWLCFWSSIRELSSRRYRWTIAGKLLQDDHQHDRSESICREVVQGSS